MTPPPGYSVPVGKVCKLKRSLYGLRQASRCWNIELSKFLVSQGYVQSKEDYSMFIRSVGDSFTVVIAYIDDLLVSGNDSGEISSLKTKLHSTFTIKDLGALTYFLGIELLDCSLASFPVPKGVKFNNFEGVVLPDPEVYRKIVGKLLYLNLTRPDISFVVQQLSQFLSEPRDVHLSVVKHVLRYLKGTFNVGLFYSAYADLKLTTYSDADWGNCMDSGRSLTCYTIFLGNSLISWKTKKQKVVSKSSIEAEYRSMSKTADEIQWLERLLDELGVCVPTPITFFL
ncbi:uncharacterized protein LOC110703119 [Chenopodium quinoa]|uniref:uncharacterized protein LOC110703119 n=1 Tax=Chenopodium quinoa TaxID=63459 RepID=UPI000B772CA9|nr:uncharacterized protein LOC110703119 [Chenopodium quinoa]